MKKVQFSSETKDESDESGKLKFAEKFFKSEEELEASDCARRTAAKEKRLQELERAMNAPPASPKSNVGDANNTQSSKGSAVKDEEQKVSPKKPGKKDAKKASLTKAAKQIVKKQAQKPQICNKDSNNKFFGGSGINVKGCQGFSNFFQGKLDN